MFHFFLEGEIYFFFFMSFHHFFLFVCLSNDLLIGNKAFDVGTFVRGA